MSAPMTSQSAFSFPEPNSSSTQQETFISFSPRQTFTSEPVTNPQPNPQTLNTFQNQQFPQYHTATLSSSNAKFPYLKKEEYETWAMKMEYWIINTDHNLWKIILNGNSKKKNKTEEAEQVYGLMARFKSDFPDHAGNAAGSVYDVAAEFAMMGISLKAQTCPFECNSKSKLKKNYDRLENIYNDSFIQAKLEMKEWEVKLIESLSRFDKWMESSKNLAKLINNSMSTRTKLGLGFKECIGSDEVFDLSTPSVFDPKPATKEVKSLHERFVKAGEMHEVPPSITGTFMPTLYKSDLEETQVTFGSKSTTSSINTSESNDFVSCDNSNKSSESEPRDFASCVSTPTTTDSFSTIEVKILSKSDVKDPSPTNGFPSCSVKENVNHPRNLCNKSRIADRIHRKNNFVRSKTCFVCRSKFHLIKDCDVYDTVPSVVLQAASVP
nr:serine-threonine/tyrosine-protein kinase catalytic domain-containing protein [Tanacetum cinerariifolium]